MASLVEIQPDHLLQPKRKTGGNDCEPDGAERRCWIQLCLFINTGWVKVPVQFPALAVVARGRAPLPQPYQAKPCIKIRLCLT